MTVSRHPNNQGVSLSQWRYTATGGETTLSGTDGFATALAYTVGAEQLFVNGVLLERGVDYVATTGTTVTGLTALVAGDIVTVSSPSSFSVANAISKTTVTAKGDLLAATGSGTVTNLPVGADGQILVANSASATGVAWAGPTFAAGKNKIINGDFGVWQRGTTFTNPAAGTYTADRFIISYDTAPSAGSVAQVAFDYSSSPASDKLPISGYNSSYFLRSTITTVGSATIAEIQQRIENVRTFAGQTVTLSFWAKADSARSSIVYLYQNSGGTGTAYSATPTLSVTTSWQRYSFTLSLGSISGFTIGAGSSLYAVIRQAFAAGSVLDIWGVQVEAGSVATPFTTATGTFQGELAACQRYAYALTASAAAPIGVGQANSTTAGVYTIFTPVQLRTIPSLVVSSTANQFNVTNGADTQIACATVPALNISTPNVVRVTATVASGLTAGQGSILFVNNANATFLLSAEL